MSQPITVDFVMDEPYLREFHAEMVATRLPRWRFHRRLALFALLCGVLGVGMSVWSGRLDGAGLSLLIGGFAGATLWRLDRRRERWLTYQRKLPSFGANITMTLELGELIQSSDKSSDVIGIRTGEVLETQRGWFVTYDIMHLGTETVDEAVNTRKASIYLPDSAFDPPGSRDAFAEALSGPFEVRRLR